VKIIEKPLGSELISDIDAQEPVEPTKVRSSPIVPYRFDCPLSFDRYVWLHFPDGETCVESARSLAS